MPQLSRPLQVALAAVGLLVVVWFVALRGHSSSSEPTATTPASSPRGSSGGVYHGSAPGVEGLTRDIQKAHAAAGQSEHTSAQLQQKAAQASGEAAATPAASATPSASGSAPAKALAHNTQAKSPSTKATTRPTTATPHAVSHAVSATMGQAWVERQLRQKVTVALLFYTPRAYDDSRTRRELEKLIGEERSQHAKIAVRVAPASAVGSYGSFTRVASIYQTPTLLLVTPSGEVKPPITGLTDGFSIEQAIDEKTQP